MLELSDQDFKITMINMLRALMERVDTMQEETDDTSRQMGTLRRNQKEMLGGFPGGAVVKNPPDNAGDTGSSPGPGRSHMPRSNEAHAPQLLSLRSRAREPQLLSPRATTTEAHMLRTRALQQEKPPQ